MLHHMPRSSLLLQSFKEVLFLMLHRPLLLQSLKMLQLMPRFAMLLPFIMQANLELPR